MSTRLLRRAGLTLAVLAASLAIAVPVSAAPPGNNGTIKVDGVVFDDHPNNEPHVGCVFQIDFYGFEQGNLPATVTFRAQAPSGTGIVPTSFVLADLSKNDDDNSGGGSEVGLDASITYTLAIPATLTAHPQQGYHIKLTIEAVGTEGRTITKHKVFWVTGCDPCEEPPTENQDT